MDSKEVVLRYLEENGDKNFVSKSCNWNIDPRVIGVLTKLKEHELICCVAGGYPAYLAKKTNQYRDVDIFIQSSVKGPEAQRIVKNIFGDQFRDIELWNSDQSYQYEQATKKCYNISSIVSIHDDVGEIQLVFVDHLRVSQFSRELFCFEIINGFDQYLCKSGFFVDKATIRCINLEVPTKGFLLEATGSMKLRRLSKYAERDQVCLLNPNKLSVMSISKIVSGVLGPCQNGLASS